MQAQVLTMTGPGFAVVVGTAPTIEAHNVHAAEPAKEYEPAGHAEQGLLTFCERKPGAQKSPQVEVEGGLATSTPF